MIKAEWQPVERTVKTNFKIFSENVLLFLVLIVRVPTFIFNIFLYLAIENLER